SRSVAARCTGRPGTKGRARRRPRPRGRATGLATAFAIRRSGRISGPPSVPRLRQQVLAIDADVLERMRQWRAPRKGTGLKRLLVCAVDSTRGDRSPPASGRIAPRLPEERRAGDAL